MQTKNSLTLLLSLALTAFVHTTSLYSQNPQRELLDPLSMEALSPILKTSPLQEEDSLLQPEILAPLSPQTRAPQILLPEVERHSPSLTMEPTQQDHQEGEATLFFQEERQSAKEEREEQEHEEKRSKTQGITGSFTNVDIIEFISFLGNAMGKNFIFDENDLQFQITVVTSEEEPLENLLGLLLQRLQANGLTITEQGNTLLIHKNPAVRSPGEVVIEGETGEPQGEVITQVFRLNTLDPDKISEIIRPLLSNDALILVLRDSNNLILTDLKSNVGKIADLIAHLDAPIGGMEIGQYASENSLAISLISSAEQILRPLAQGNPFYLVPYEATNSVFIISNPFLVERAISILRFLDISQGKAEITQLEDLKREVNLSPVLPSDISDAEKLRLAEEERRQRLLEQGWRMGPNGELLPPGTALTPQARAAQGLPKEHIGRTLFFIYKLKYRDGEQILQALKQIAGTLNTAGNINADLVTAIDSIQWIESTNSLIFTGTAEALERIKELVEELDVPLRQVFIEVLILDTTINDALTYSVDWGSQFGGGDWAGGQSFLRPGSILPTALATAGIDSTPSADTLARTQGYNLGIIGQNITKMGMRFNSVGALVTAIHSDQFSDIIMNPKILTEDNHTAELFVGTTNRLRTQTISNGQNDILSSNYETVDVGTTLKITPLLGANDIITLIIEEENSNEAPTANAPQTQEESDIFLLPIATKSSTMTRVHVPNKYFLVLSGMINDRQLRTENRVPCLGGFPIIGTVFRQKDNLDRKRNLLLFIRPEIIDTDEDYRRITERNQGIQKEKDKFLRSWTYETDEALEWIHWKTTERNESCAPYKQVDCTVCCPTK